MEELLNIVDDNDQIVGVKSREEIHRDGFAHREVHVYFITQAKEIIFQHRAKDKDVYPDLLDATVGGHVEIGQSYEEAAIKETEEETGLKLNISDFVFINKIKKYLLDEKTGKINNVHNSRFLYFFKGKITDLKIEKGKALGFEAWPIEKLLNLNESDRIKFIPYILEFSTTELLEFIENLKI